MESRWIWPFELMDKLGEGGMGVVYRARYVGNNRIVAIKLLPEEVAANEKLVARFEREMEVLKQLRHPNIVHCFGGTCQSNERFYAMELVEGGTLADLLAKKGRFSWDMTIEYGLQMCAGLAYAHERGIVHRDLKPGNFLMTAAGQLKLSDFGLAAVASGQRITAAGRTVGTFQYMAPEQIRGKPPVSNRTDLYALGCVLYELLSGETPYEGATPAETLHLHLEKPIPHVRDLVPDCPPELDQLIVHLMAKDPEDRPERAEDVAIRLESIVLPSRAHRPSPLDLHAETPRMGVEAITPKKKLSSEVDVPTPAEADLPDRPLLWAIGGLLVAMMFFQWLHHRGYVGRAHRFEERWVQELVGPGASDPATAGRVLAGYGNLSDRGVRRLVDALGDERLPVRTAALQVLEGHPAAARPYLTAIGKHQRTEEDPLVRNAIPRAVEAIRNGPGSFSWASLFWWLCLLTLSGIIGWLTWPRWGQARLAKYTKTKKKSSV